MTRPQGTPARFSLSIHCGDRRLADLGVDDRPQALAMGDPGGVGGKVGILQQIGEAELLEQALDDRGRAGRDRDVAVPAWNRP